MLIQLTKLFITFISLFIPVKPKLFLFGSWYGNKYGDNARYFFEWMSKNKPEYHCIWITKNSTVKAELLEQNYQVEIQSSLYSIWLHLRAEAVFCNTSHESDLFGVMLNRKSVVFNLWHGTPMKKIGLDAIHSDIDQGKLGVKKRSFLSKVVPENLFNSIKRAVKHRILYLASSSKVGEILQSAMGVTKTEIIIGGYPKLDHLIKAPKKLNSGYILYAPTYRGEYNSENDLLTAFNFDIEAVDKWLELNQKHLVIRLHPANQLPAEMIDRLKNSKKITVGGNKDLYETLLDFELVITDFSSLYFDCLATCIPVVLAPFGVDEYIKNDRPLYFSLEELFPLKMASNWGQLIEVISRSPLDLKQFDLIKQRFYIDKKGEASFTLFEKINNYLTK